MTDPVALKARRFRRVALIGSAFALLLWVWSVLMFLHFNAGPASAQFGVKTMVRVAAVGLPGPVLLALLAWKARLTPCRVVGWLSLLPVVAFAGLIAGYTSIELRPPLFFGNYDRATREAEGAWQSIIDTDAVTHAEFKSLFAVWKHPPHPLTREEITDLHARIGPVIQATAQSLERVRSLESTMRKPFDDLGVSSARRDEYMNQTFVRVNLAEFQQSYVDVLVAYRGFEQRLKLLLDHFGEWQWTDDNLLKFNDPDLSDEYNRLTAPVEPVP